MPVTRKGKKDAAPVQDETTTTADVIADEALVPVKFTKVVAGPDIDPKDIDLVAAASSLPDKPKSKPKAVKRTAPQSPPPVKKSKKMPLVSDNARDHMVPNVSMFYATDATEEAEGLGSVEMVLLVGGAVLVGVGLYYMFGPKSRGISDAVVSPQYVDPNVI